VEAGGSSCGVGFRPTLIAVHHIRDFGVGLQPLLPLVVAPAPESEFPPASGGVQGFSDLTGKTKKEFWHNDDQTSTSCQGVKITTFLV